MIPFLDLKAQYNRLKPEMDQAMSSVLERTAYILGEELDQFEQAFADYIGVKHCIGVSTGTNAIELALRAYDIGPGDEVITVPNTFIATTEAITHAGAATRWVEVDPHTYNMAPDQIEVAITSNTKAVLPVHLYGQPADMQPILDIAHRHNLIVIEDAAQAHGAKYQGQKVGTFGDAACFSFYPGKNLGAYGDGGAVVTNNDEAAERIRRLRHHGQEERYIHLEEGFSDRLDNLQAAVLKVKLPYLDGWNEGRRAAAAIYDRLLQRIPQVVIPHVLAGTEPVYHLYVIQTPERDRVRAILDSAGIQTGIHYPIPLHQQPAYAYLGHPPQDFPISAALGPKILSLPIYPEITETDIEQVVDVLCQAINSL